MMVSEHKNRLQGTDTDSDFLSACFTTFIKLKSTVKAAEYS